MSYNPDDDLYEAEPKLLSIPFECFPAFPKFPTFPTFFNPPIAPPNYDLIMAGNTRYHRLPEEPRVSMESSTGGDLDAGDLLLDPLRNDESPTSSKGERKFSCHPTLILRLLATCILSISFILFVVDHRPRSLSAIILVSFVVARNVIVIIHHIVSQHIRVHIEFRNRQPRVRAPKRSVPEWLKQGWFHLLLDLVLFANLLITTIIATQGSRNWYRWNAGNLVVPACVLAYVGK